MSKKMLKIATLSTTALTLFGMAQPIVSHANQNTVLSSGLAESKVQSVECLTCTINWNANISGNKNERNQTIKVYNDKVTYERPGGYICGITQVDVIAKDGTTRFSQDIDKQTSGEETICTLEEGDTIRVNLQNTTDYYGRYRIISSAIATGINDIHSGSYKTGSNTFSYQATLKVKNNTVVEQTPVEDVVDEVNALFTDPTTRTQLVDGVTQTKIDAVKNKVAALQDTDQAWDVYKSENGGGETTKADLLSFVSIAEKLNTKQADTTSDTDVTYDYTAPTPAEPQWYGVVPSSISFSDKAKDVDVPVSIVNEAEQKTPYTGSKSVDVKVKSDNGYKLKDAKVSGGDIEYKLDKAGLNKDFFTADTTEQELGVLSKGQTSIISKAHLTGTAKKSGQYIDTLHYTFTEK